LKSTCTCTQAGTLDAHKQERESQETHGLEGEDFRFCHDSGKTRQNKENKFKSH